MSMRLAGLSALILSFLAAWSLVGCAPASTAAPAPAATVMVILPSEEATPSVLPPLEEVPYVASVNGVPITSAAFGQELLWTARLLQEQQGVDWYSEQGQTQLPRLREQVLDRLIDQVLLRQLAEAEGVEVDEGRARALAASAARQIVAQSDYQSFEEFLKAYQLREEDFLDTFRLQLLYEGMLQRHGGPAQVEQVRLRHIQVLTEEDAEEVEARLAAGEAFEEVAREMSVEPGTRRLGGLIEWLPRGQLPPALEEVAFRLPVGQVSQVFETDSGYHVIQVLGREVRPLRPEIQDRYRQQNFDRWFAEQKAQAEIERFVTFLPPEE